MSFWTLYFLSRLDNLIGLSLFCLVVGTILSLISAFIYIMVDPKSTVRDDERGLNIAKSISRITIPVVIISLILQIFLPNFKQALTFIGIDYITHNERVLENTDRALDVFESYIDGKLNQLKGGKDEVSAINEEEVTNQ